MNSEIIVLLHRAYWLEIKIDVNERTTQRKDNLDEKLNCSFYLVSAADGINVVRIFEEIIQFGVQKKSLK